MTSKSQNKLSINIMYNFFYQIITLCFPLVITPYISRVLGATGIGNYSYYYSLTYYFVIFAMLGLNNYGNREIASLNKTNMNIISKKFWEIYFMQCICTGVILLSYILFVCMFDIDMKMGIIMSMYVLSCFFDVNWFFFGIEKFNVTVIRNVIIKITSLIAIFLFVKSISDIYIYSFIMIFSIFISQLYLWVLLKKYIIFIRPHFSDVIRHLKPNIILFLPIIAVSLYKIMDKIMIGNMCDISELGFYENVEKIVNIPVGFVTALGTVMLPRISNLVANSDMKNIQNYFRLSVFFTLFISSALVFGIIAVLPEFIPVFFGNGFDKCLNLGEVMLPTVFFIGCSNIIRTQYIIPMRKDYIYIKSVIIGAILNVIVNIVLIPKMGSLGAAIGTFFAEFAVFLYQFVIVNKTFKITNIFYKSSFFVLLGIIMLFFITFIKNENLMITIIIKAFVGALVYLLLSFLYYLKILKRKI